MSEWVNEKKLPHSKLCICNRGLACLAVLLTFFLFFAAAVWPFHCRSLKFIWSFYSQDSIRVFIAVQDLCIHIPPDEDSYTSTMSILGIII